MARVPLKELPKLVQAIFAYDGEDTPRRREITRDALLFTLLTWARTSETRFATWDEFEGDRKSTRLKLQSLMRISYAVFCLKKKTTHDRQTEHKDTQHTKSKIRMNVTTIQPTTN